MYRRQPDIHCAFVAVAYMIGFEQAGDKTYIRSELEEMEKSGKNQTVLQHTASVLQGGQQGEQLGSWHAASSIHETSVFRED